MITGVLRKLRSVCPNEIAPVESRCTNGTRMKKTNSTCPRSTTAKLKICPAPYTAPKMAYPIIPASKPVISAGK